jgi:hypothetical protein
MGLLRDVIDKLIVGLPKKITHFRDSRSDQGSSKIEMLACSLMEYGRMWRNLYPEQSPTVHVKDLSFRFRETRRTVIKALRLLETQGQARRTESSDRWRLKV